MNIWDIIGCVFIVLLIGGALYVIPALIIESYHEIRSYHIMQEECKANSDICFCASGSCSIKSSCSYSQINGGSMLGGCNTTRLCEIFKRADWKEGLWDYNCT